MREIRFRGKRIDNGEWVHGYLVKVVSAAGSEWHIHVNAKDPDDYHKVYPVDPETVGQYTGAKDFDDIEIYEGDIVQDSDEGRVFEVHFDDVYWQFNAFDRHSGETQELSDWFEVIGNIHDNPELLQEVANV